MSRSSKYGNRKIVLFGRTFDSKLEGNRYLVLREAAENGRITDLELQPPFELQPSFTDAAGKKHRAAHYVADFRYTLPNGQTIVEDAKGIETDMFKLKIKLAIFAHPELAHQFRLVKRPNAAIPPRRKKQ